MSMLRHMPGLVFLFIAGLPFAAMLGTRTPRRPAQENTETLVIISPHRREVEQEYQRGFRDWMAAKHGRNVDLRWLDVGGTSKAMKDIESRYKARPDAPGVDMLFGGGVDPFIRGMAEGWLVPVTVPDQVIAAIPERCAGFPTYDSGGHWYGVALSGFGIVYNRPLLERLELDEPSEWDDLARPGFFGWVGSGDPRSSGSVHMCYEIILQAYGYERGWATITRLCANVRRFGEGGSAAPLDVAAGEVAAGMVIDQYAQTVISAVGAEMLAFVLPGGATVINPDAIAVLRGAPSPGLAERFVEYVLSEPGQRLLFQPRGVNGQRFFLHRMPVRADLYDDRHAPRANPYRFREGFRYDTQLGSRRWDTLNDMMGVWLIGAHAGLRRAWQRVIEQGCPQELVRVLCAPPVAEDELGRLGDEWGDSRRRLEITSQWARAARERYAAIGRGE